MALKQPRECKGITAEYWKIINLIYSAVGENTHIVLALYFNQDARNMDINNYLTTTTFDFTGCLNREEAYNKIKESKPEQRTIKAAVYSEDMLTTLEPAVQEMVETNLFFGAIDC